MGHQCILAHCPPCLLRIRPALCSRVMPYSNCWLVQHRASEIKSTGEPGACYYVSAEDDGYLATYVYDSASDSSDFVVYDAKTCSEKPVASVRLPQRVPYGFHGMHINAAQFEAQFPFDIHFLPSVD